MNKFITARTYPLDIDGTFQSEVAEFVYQEVKYHGITRDIVREMIQAFLYAESKSKQEMGD